MPFFHNLMPENDIEPLQTQNANAQVKQTEINLYIYIHIYINFICSQTTRGLQRTSFFERLFPLMCWKCQIL